MDYKDLTPEQIEKAKACSSAEEIVELAKAEGVELSNEDLDRISGGDVWEPEPYYVIYHCGEQIRVDDGKGSVTCPVCGTLVIVNR